MPKNMRPILLNGNFFGLPRVLCPSAPAPPPPPPPFTLQVTHTHRIKFHGCRMGVRGYLWVLRRIQVRFVSFALPLAACWWQISSVCPSVHPFVAVSFHFRFVEVIFTHLLSPLEYVRECVYISLQVLGNPAGGHPWYWFHFHLHFHFHFHSHTDFPHPFRPPQRGTQSVNWHDSTTGECPCDSLAVRAPPFLYSY